jgi:hypothetical protein
MDNIQNNINVYYETRNSIKWTEDMYPEDRKF